MWIFGAFTKLGRFLLFPRGCLRHRLHGMARCHDGEKGAAYTFCGNPNDIRGGLCWSITWFQCISTLSLVMAPVLCVAVGLRHIVCDDPDAI